MKNNIKRVQLNFLEYYASEIFFNQNSWKPKVILRFINPPSEKPKAPKEVQN